MDLFHHRAVFQADHPVTAFGKLEVVGHEHQRGAALAIKAENQFRHRRGGFAVKITGGFVAEENLRRIDEGARQGHALLFAAGKLHRIMIGTLAQADAFKQSPRFVFATGFAAKFEWHEHVFERGQGRDELKILKHKTDVPVAHRGARVFIKAVKQLPRHGHTAATRQIKSGAQSQQGGLATAARTDDRKARAGVEFKADLAQNSERTGSAGVRLGEPLDFQHDVIIHTRNGPRKTESRTNASPRSRISSMMRFLFGFLIIGLVTLSASETKTIVCLGDSLTAGYGLPNPEAQAYPALIQDKIDAAKLPWRVVNAGISGDTTAGGLRRINWLLRQPIDILILALGGNDGLRGVDPAVTQENLIGIIERARARYPDITIILAGMQMPANLGPAYQARYREIFPAVAKAKDCELIPFLLEGVGGDPELNQPDMIHPTAEGQKRIAETVWTVLQPQL